MGTVCSLILIIIVCTYAYIKVDVFLLKKDVDILFSTQKNYFNETYVFDHDKGLNFAVGFTAFDTETEDILDPSYGRIAFIKHAWGTDENGVPFSVYEEIESHTCTKEELGLEGDNSRFMPIEERNLRYVQMYQKKLRCISKDEMKVAGDFNSASANLLNMQLQRC